MTLLWAVMAIPRVTKSENFSDSKIFVAKTFRIERVNCDIVKYVTKVRRTDVSLPFETNM